MNLHYNIWKTIRGILNLNRTYYSRNYHYEILFESYKNLDEYYNLLAQMETKNSLKTDNTITIQKGHAFNQKKKEIIKIYKKPRAVFKIREENIKIDIYHFKIKLGEYYARLEIHMNNNSLFCYKYKFSNNLASQHRHEIIGIIKDKYLKGALIDTSKQYIIDNNQTILNIENQVNFEISYINIMSNVFQKFNINKEQQEKKKMERLLNKRKELKEVL